MIPLLLLAFAGPPLQAPWPCTDNIVVTQGNNGPWSHQGTEAYAWDFDLDEGDPILAAAGGTVIQLRKDSTVGGCSSSYGNDANYVVIDHGDGTSGLYLHLAPFSSPLELGDTVQTGDFIGRVGLTGWVCGDHLHFQVQEICGSWYCQSLPAEFAGHGVPAYLDAIGSSNCPDCDARLDGSTTTIESSDLACFEGMLSSWGDSTEGEGGHHFHALALDAPSATARWNFEVTQPGDYEVLVHVPTSDATATGASYAIHHADGSDVVVIDQQADKGWQSLGTYPFTGGDQRIELTDGSGDDPGAGRRVAFDAVRLEYVPSSGDGSGSGSATGGDGDGDDGDGDGDDDGADSATGDDGNGSDGDGGDGVDSGLPEGGSDDAGDGMVDAGTGGGGMALPEWRPGDPPQSCACAAGDSGSRVPMAGVLVLLLAGLRRPSSRRVARQ